MRAREKGRLGASSLVEAMLTTSRWVSMYGQEQEDKSTTSQSSRFTAPPQRPIMTVMLRWVFVSRKKPFKPRVLYFDVAGSDRLNDDGGKVAAEAQRGLEDRAGRNFCGLCGQPQRSEARIGFG